MPSITNACFMLSFPAAYTPSGHYLGGSAVVELSWLLTWLKSGRMLSSCLLLSHI